MEPPEGGNNDDNLVITMEMVEDRKRAFLARFQDGLHFYQQQYEELCDHGEAILGETAQYVLNLKATHRIFFKRALLRETEE